MGSRNLLSIVLLIVLTSFFSLNCYSKGNERNDTKIKGMFVFGSSLADNGNNAFLKTIANPNVLPYGIDFPEGPTGRFTNGKTVIDVFGDYLRLPHFIPPFYDPSTKGTKIINGVDFASGGSGILNDTGSELGEVASLSTQMRNFEETTLTQLKVQLGLKSEKFLRTYIFVVGTGANDYTSNYFARPINQTVEVFTINLILLLSGHIKNLYNLGGRKFVLIGLYPLGCYPIHKAQTNCNKKLNDAANIYNSHLKSMIDDLHSQMPDSHLVFVNSYNIINDLITNPISQGFKDASDPCCELFISTRGEKRTSCNKDGKVCEDRKTYIFFDGVHTTEAANSIIASKAFHSNLQSQVYPINITQLSII
ncbi:GDSL esterase/lipase At4g16230-like [Euphorbia lathyris]|uniref:GDSL esterase/lipase At4g16230-like n=1 Tax=Euphorbia lathyris TaxID=212925 RepID=UPI0033142114